MPGNVLRSTSKEKKWLIGLWILFLLLVALGVHGSSVGAATELWAPERPYDGYLLNPPRRLITGLPADKAELVQDLLMAKSRAPRGDEWLTFTPYSLSQLSHQPKFPVVNTNVGEGENMLLWCWQYPVWHISALARPATWGYFFLGAQRGLAWYWWFQVFACFTALYLLLVIILKGHKALAAFGSFWFCGSAYIICWSLWPAHMTFFAVLACVSAYYLLASPRRVVVGVSAALLGLSVAGFSMMLYPPWQISLSYISLFVFAGLFIRDKLYRSFNSVSRFRLLCIAGALFLAAGLIASFVASSLPSLRVISNTVYPAKRVSSGGDYSFALLFKGTYNLIGIYHHWEAIYHMRASPFFINQSETASFYHLFPAAFLAILLSKRIMRQLGVFGWIMVFHLVLTICFMLIGLPERVSRLTLLNYVPATRMDLALGLSSILLFVYLLALNRGNQEVDRSRWRKVMPFIAGAIIATFFFVHGLIVIKVANGFVSLGFVSIASLMAGLLSFCFFSGRQNAFCIVMSVVIVGTSGFFNPLATALSSLYGTELAQQVMKTNQQSSDHPLWLCYGSIHSDTLIVTLGGRALAGTQWPPQLSLWGKFDPKGRFKDAYNKYAQIHLRYDGEASPVSLVNTGTDAFEVHISPNDPILKEMGARYVLAFDFYQQTLSPAKLIPVYKSSNGRFTIFEIPR